VEEEYSFEELQSLNEYMQMMRAKEVEYLSLAHAKMEYDTLPDEVKHRLQDFDCMDADEIRERQAELKAYNTYLTYLSDPEYSAVCLLLEHMNCGSIQSMLNDKMIFDEDDAAVLGNSCSEFLSLLSQRRMYHYKCMTSFMNVLTNL
jgi:hypothetical protein